MEQDTFNTSAKNQGKQNSGKIKSDEELLTKHEDSKQIVERIEIENTPFTAIKTGEEWHLTLGRYRLTQALKTKDEALAEGLNESWWRIMQIIQIMIDEHEIKKGKMQEGTKLDGQIEQLKNAGVKVN